MENRRDVASRKLNVFHKLSISLVKAGLTPNFISVLSACFGLAAGVSIYFLSSVSGARFYCYLFIAFLSVQLRLICNLIDGLMAVEGGLKTKTGELYNDIPDRLSDSFIFIGIGYSCSQSSELSVFFGWLVTVLALLTAYIRVLGASMGAGHFFIGPMAKQHRMATVSLSLVATGFEYYFTNMFLFSFFACLIIVCIGCLFTGINRLIKISAVINSK